MPSLLHSEQHFRSSDTIRDVVIGMSDGLTVPFALAAGLTGAIAASALVVTAGLAEVVAGAIAMGLGGYLAARTDRDHYDSERRREQAEIARIPEEEAREVHEILVGYGLPVSQAGTVVAAIRADAGRWVDFMMRFELGLEAPEPGRAWRSALTIALSYVTGGFVPLLPYMLVADAATALWWSIGGTLLALAAFGVVRAHLTGQPLVLGALRTTVVGGLAAGAAFLIARAVS